jgi:hypothetical protein
VSTTETPTTAALPAAWYRDPSGRHERRWWDGGDWTDQVADGDVVSSDPPFRTPQAAVDQQVEEQPVEHVEEPAPARAEPTFDHDALFAPTAPAQDAPESESASESEVEEEPETFEEAGLKKRLPIDQRPSTAPTSDRKVNVRLLPVIAVVLLVVGGSLWWGFQNKSTAEQWQDRGEELQDELVRTSSNADALEQALARSASRAAGLEDSQETFTQVQDAARATAQQLNQCVNDVNGIIALIANGSDPTTQIDRANESCSQASINSDQLISILDAIADQ